MAGRYIPPKPATLEGDQQRLGVTDEQLDREINPLQFTDIAHHIGSTTTFEIAFGLDDNERQQINTTKILKGNLDGTIQMFELWKMKVKRSATYRNLLRIVYGTVRNAEMGEKIFQIAAPVETETPCKTVARPSRSGRGTPEHKTMVKCTGLLVNEFTEHVEDFGDAFYSDNIIGPGTWDKTKSKIRESKDKARDLVGALTSKVQSSAEYFEKIVQIVHDQGDWTENIIKELRRVFQKVGINSGIKFPEVENTKRERATTNAGTPTNYREPARESKSGMLMCGSVSCDSDEGTSGTILEGNSASAHIRHSVLWPANANLKVHFLNGDDLKIWNWKHGDDPITKSLILEWARVWNRDNKKWPKISQLEASKESADIRVKLVNDAGVRSHSLVGASARKVLNHNKPTMVLSLSNIPDQQLQRSTVIHEFGHALGLDHEHQRSRFWDILGTKDGEGKNKFIYSIKELMAGKAVDDATNQIVSFLPLDAEHEKKDCSDTDCYTSNYDPHSIMHYWFDKRWLRPQFLQDQCQVPLTPSERTVIQGVITRDFKNGQLVENPSEHDYETLERAYSSQQNSEDNLSEGNKNKSSKQREPPTIHKLSAEQNTPNRCPLITRKHVIIITVVVTLLAVLVGIVSYKHL